MTRPKPISCRPHRVRFVAPTAIKEPPECGNAAQAGIEVFELDVSSDVSVDRAMNDSVEHAGLLAAQREV